MEVANCHGSLDVTFMRSTAFVAEMYNVFGVILWSMAFVVHAMKGPAHSCKINCWKFPCWLPLGVEPRIIVPYIFKAVISKDLECLRRFIRVGADLDCTDLDGRTPLFLAASEGLLEVRVDKECADLGGHAPLVLAASKREVWGSRVTLLVEEGNATVDAVDSWGHTAEGDALLAGHHEVAQYLRKQRRSCRDLEALNAMTSMRTMPRLRGTHCHELDAQNAMT
eukprot:1162053-Pelagomonas_calceolata.AAC.2